jgi:membrane protein implicated in regulation of membrane protease activity
MKKPRWSTRTVIRYALFQIPDLAILILILVLVRRWIDLPSWLTWGFITFWMLKDIILFPLFWRAYDRSPANDPFSAVGARGTAENRLSPSGFIRVKNELWRAEVIGEGQGVNEGETVRVEAVRGLTLLVRPEKQEGPVDEEDFHG